MFEYIVYLFDIALYKPLFNFLVLLYNYVPGHDFGVAIILLTVIIRIILYPLAAKSLKSQKKLQELQPIVQEIQKKYKDDKEKLAKETLEVYRKEKINPFSGFFLALVQLPVLIALYRIFWQGFKDVPGLINANFLGIINLDKPNIAFAVLAGALQYFQTKMMLPKTQNPSASSGRAPDFSKMMQTQMLYFFPILTVIILLGLPSALGLYWIASSIFSIAQQYFILRKTQH